MQKYCMLNFLQLIIKPKIEKAIIKAATEVANRMMKEMAAKSEGIKECLKK